MAFRPLGLVLLCTMLHLFIPFQIEAQEVTTTRRPDSNTTNLDDLIDFPDDDNGTGNGTDTGDKETPTGLFNLFGLGTVLTYLVYTGVGLLVVLLVTLYISTNCTGAQKTRPLTIANVEAFKLSQAGPEAQRAIASGMDEFAAGGANDPYNHKKAILAKFLSESNQNSKQLKKKTHTGDTVIDMKMSHDVKVTVEDPELMFDSVSVVGAARTANNKMPFYDNSKNKYDQQGRPGTADLQTDLRKKGPYGRRGSGSPTDYPPLKSALKSDRRPSPQIELQSGDADRKNKKKKKKEKKKKKKKKKRKKEKETALIVLGESLSRTQQPKKKNRSQQSLSSQNTTSSVHSLAPKPSKTGKKKLKASRSAVKQKAPPEELVLPSTGRRQSTPVELSRRPSQAIEAPRRPSQAALAPRRPSQAIEAPRRPSQATLAPRRPSQPVDPIPDLPPGLDSDIAGEKPPGKKTKRKKKGKPSKKTSKESKDLSTKPSNISQASWKEPEDQKVPLSSHFGLGAPKKPSKSDEDVSRPTRGAGGLNIISTLEECLPCCRHATYREPAEWRNARFESTHGTGGNWNPEASVVNREYDQSYTYPTASSTSINVDSSSDKSSDSSSSGSGSDSDSDSSSSSDSEESSTAPFTIILNVPGSKGLESYADGGTSEVGSDQSASEAESSAYSEGESEA